MVRLAGVKSLLFALTSSGTICHWPMKTMNINSRAPIKKMQKADTYPESLVKVVSAANTADIDTD